MQCLGTVRALANMRNQPHWHLRPRCDRQGVRIEEETQPCLIRLINSRNLLFLLNIFSTIEPWVAESAVPAAMPRALAGGIRLTTGATRRLSSRPALGLN